MLLIVKRVAHAFAAGCVLAFVASVAVAAEESPQYEVELIVFQPNEPGDSGGERLDNDIDFASLRQARALGAGKVADAGHQPSYTLLRKSELRLGYLVRRLTKKKASGVLVHIGWRQPIVAGEEVSVLVYDYGVPPDTLLPADAPSPRLPKDRFAVIGSTSVLAARPFKFALDVVWNPPAAEGKARARLRETRRIKLGELHYFDHPQFGVIAQLRPVKTAAPEPAGFPVSPSIPH